MLKILDQICLQKIGLRFINTFYFKETECNWYELKKKTMENRTCLECDNIVRGRVDKNSAQTTAAMHITIELIKVVKI